MSELWGGPGVWLAAMLSVSLNLSRTGCWERFSGGAAALRPTRKVAIPSDTGTLSQPGSLDEEASPCGLCSSTRAGIPPTSPSLELQGRLPFQGLGVAVTVTWRSGGSAVSPYLCRQEHDSRCPAGTRQASELL